MLVAALLMGGLTAYYFGVRAGAWAAAATVVLLLAAAFVPRLQLPAWIALVAAAVAIRMLGARRQRPLDAVLAVRWLRQQWKRLTGRD
jgi:hypothetical protein